ncbi:hypothetical protein QBC34DRAFT_142443 [Podospora aff. communis PSN243]|uniref:Mediator of RNA polymerase II transcription subunit 11 n=1 Tax=Podospora aff. communis PSN243 TaxID=3040156 RepID=A0AAV9GGL0_9PEZI|nr:hypothetical protein QBC34DRAFT_142443 [Podospora aff. communis PSN243]
MADPSKESIKQEERAEQDLAHLNQLHLQLRHLRSALPRMMEPMTSKQSSPEELYANFMKSLEGTTKEIEDFKKAYTSEKTKGAFQRGTESRKANPQGIKPWRASDDPDWTTPDPEK